MPPFALIYSSLNNRPPKRKLNSSGAADIGESSTSVQPATVAVDRSAKSAAASAPCESVDERYMSDLKSDSEGASGTVGRFDGSAVGFGVGRCEGCGDGRGEGLAEGFGDGRMEGNAVGSGVGQFVGFGLG